MSTPFDDDALQEGLAHGLYEVSRSPTANQGLGQSLLSGLDTPEPGRTTLYLYKGIDHNPFDHLAVSVNGSHIYGKVPVPGMDAMSLIATVPGLVEPAGPNRQLMDKITIPTDSGQRTGLLQYLQDRSNPITYNAKTDNCVDYIYGGLEGAGVKLPPRDFIETPDQLMKELHKMYDAPTPPPQ